MSGTIWGIIGPSCLSLPGLKVEPFPSPPNSVDFIRSLSLNAANVLKLWRLQI